MTDQENKPKIQLRADGTLPRNWESTQLSVFTKWVNMNLKVRNIHVDNIAEDFSDGVKLINLLEILSKKEIGTRWHQAPKQRIQMIENCNIAVGFIQSQMNIKLVAIGGTDIVDKNLKLTLGLFWSVISACHLDMIMSDIKADGQSSRDALLQWCKTNTAGYANVAVTDFSKSWSSGLAFCALINKFVPEILNFDELDPNDQEDCVITALDACKKLGLNVFLDPSDLIGVEAPDEKAIITQAAEMCRFLTDKDLMDEARNRLFKAQSINEKIARMIAESNGEIKDNLISMANGLRPLLVEKNLKYCPLCEQLFLCLVAFYNMLRKCVSKEEIDALQAEIAKAKQDLQQSNSQLESVQALLNKSQAELQQSNDEKNKLQTTITAKAAELDQMKKDLESQLNQLKTNLHQKDSESLENKSKSDAEIAELKNKLDQISKENSENSTANKKRIDELQGQLDAAGAQISALKTDKSDRESEIENLKQKITFSNSDASAKDNELQSLQGRITDKTAEALKFQQECQKLQDELNSLKTANEEAQKSAQKESKRATDLEEAIKKSKLETAAEIAALKKSLEESSSLKKSGSHTDDEFDSLKKSNKSLERVLAGMKLEYGHGVLRNESLAVVEYQRAADLGDAEGRFSLARMYDRGLGAPENASLAGQLYEQAAEKEHYASMNNLASLKLNGRVGNTVSTKEELQQQAAELFKKAADNGCVAAQFNYANLLDFGRGVKKDPEEAFRYLKQAADVGHPKAMNNLAYKYENANGTTRDLNEAKRLYEAAAKTGLPIAIFNQGVILNNPQQAMPFWKKAAELGERSAINNVGVAKVEGNSGIPKDPVSGANLIKKAADKQCPDAVSNYSMLLMTANGVQKNVRGAMKILRMAANLGSTAAMTNFAVELAQGVNVVKNLAEASKYMRLAADRGESVAQYNYALMLYHGIGIEKNEKSAQSYFKFAAAKGIAEAKPYIDKLTRRKSI